MDSNINNIIIAKRNELGISISEVANYLKIKPQLVEALEQSDVSAFPGEVFYRGFLKQYLKLLNIEFKEDNYNNTNIASQPGIMTLPRLYNSSPNLIYIILSLIFMIAFSSMFDQFLSVPDANPLSSELNSRITKLVDAN